MRLFGNKKGLNLPKRKNKEAGEKLVLEEKVKNDDVLPSKENHFQNNTIDVNSVGDKTVKVTEKSETYTKPQTFNIKDADKQTEPVEISDKYLDSYLNPYKFSNDSMSDKNRAGTVKIPYIPPKKVERNNNLVILFIDGSDKYLSDVNVLNDFMNNFCKKVKDSTFLKILKIEDGIMRENEIIRGEFLNAKLPFEPYKFSKLSDRPTDLLEAVTRISRIVKDYSFFEKKIELEQYTNTIFKIENINIFIFSNCIDKVNNYNKIRKQINDINNNRQVQFVKCTCISEDDMIHVAAEMGIRSISFLGL